jgi:hypothetical protein
MKYTTILRKHWRERVYIAKRSYNRGARKEEEKGERRGEKRKAALVVTGLPPT